MKYLTLRPDYTGSCIKDDYNGPLDVENLSLPIHVINLINSWHNSYREIIPLSQNERQLYSHKIEELDKQALVIIDLIKINSTEYLKIKYFSEGKQVYINI